MFTTDDIAAMDAFEPAVNGECRDVVTVWCGDLLSWAMGRAPADSAWCTVMGNVNAVAVASLADVAAIVLCEGAALDAEAETKAREQGINVFKTELSSFQAGWEIAKKGKLVF